MIFLLYLSLGAIAGLLAGLLGIGGGLVIVPVLILAFQHQGFSPEVLTHLAVGTSLATVIVTSMASAWEHNRHGSVRWATFAFLASGIVVGSFLGVKTAGRLSGPVLQALIGVFAIAVAVQLSGIASWKRGRLGRVKRGPPFSGLSDDPRCRALLRSTRPTMTQPNKLPGTGELVGTGGVIGWVSTIFGLGGGLLTVPYLTWRNIRTQHAVGTSAACGFPIAVVGAITNIQEGWHQAALPDFSSGYVYWPAFLGIVLTSTLFARLGAKLAHRLPAETLERIFAVLLLLVGVKFIIAV